MTNKEKIIEAFKNVKDMGWIESRRSNNTGIGKTFEDYIGVKENNIDEPDLFGFEIKSHRVVSQSYVTLFTKSPSYPKKANSYLKDNFGEFYPNSQLKRLHTSIFANSYNNCLRKFSFRLINDKPNKKVYISIIEKNSKTLLDQTVYYTYNDIEKALTKKLKNLFLVYADSRYNENNKEEFLFKSAIIYTNPSINKFLDMLDNGEIMYDIRIGSYKNGKNEGKTHDHGSGFRIKECNIYKLYETMEKI